MVSLKPSGSIWPDPVAYSWMTGGNISVISANWGAAIATNEGAPGLGPRVSIYNLKGEVLARLGDIGPGEAPGQFIGPHGIAVDSGGAIYVGEVSWTVSGSHLDPPRELRSLQKLAKRS